MDSSLERRSRVYVGGLVPPVTVTATQTDSNAPALRAVDGTLNTEWAGAGVGTQLTFDRGTPKAIKQVRSAAYNGNASEWISSPEIARWTHLHIGGFVSILRATSLFESFSLDAVGRYLRIVGWGNNIYRNNSYYEVQAFGSAASSTESVADRRRFRSSSQH